MIYRKMQGTALTVSAVAMGSALFGATYSEDFAFEQLDLFAEYGGNLIDTAHVYNDWIEGERSRSEKVIGRWLASRGMRDHMIVLTKGAHPPMEDMLHSRVTRGDIRRDISESLENLGLDRIDLYLLHRDDVKKPVGEIVGWMNELIDEGIVRYWGCSNWTTARMAEANGYAAVHGLQGMRCNQTMWSLATIRREGLADRTLEPLDRAGYDYHRTTGMNLMAFTSQAKGYFPRLEAGEALPPDMLAVYGTPVNAAKLEVLKGISRKTGLSMAELSLAFFLKQPFVAIPVVAYDNHELLRAGLNTYRPEVEALLPRLDFETVF